MQADTLVLLPCPWCGNAPVCHKGDRDLWRCPNQECPGYVLLLRTSIWNNRQRADCEKCRLIRARLSKEDGDAPPEPVQAERKRLYKLINDVRAIAFGYGESRPERPA